MGWGVLGKISGKGRGDDFDFCNLRCVAGNEESPSLSISVVIR